MAQIYGIGMGPGDPELITMKALKKLETVPVIAYPAADDKPSFVRQIADNWLAKYPTKTEIIITIPMKLNLERADIDNIYDKAADDILSHANQEKDVAILCEGDPFLYGSFIYLFDALSSKIAKQNLPHQIEIIPGISSILSSASRIQKPLARQNETVLIMPALTIDDAFAQKIKSSPIIILMKIGARFGKLRALLEKMDLLNYASYIEYASLPNEKIIPMHETNFSHAPYFSMVIIHHHKMTDIS